MISTSLFLVELGELDVEDVDAGELLEQDALALHHRLGGERADRAQPEHGRAVGDDADQVAARRQLGGRRGIAHDLVAGGGDAGRIGEREVALGGQRLGRDDLDLSRPGETMVAERAFGQFIRQARLPSPSDKKGRPGRAASHNLPFRSIRRLVRPRRLELPRLAALAPQASASTNSAMAAPDRWRRGIPNRPRSGKARGRHCPCACGREIPILPQ